MMNHQSTPEPIGVEDTGSGYSSDQEEGEVEHPAFNESFSSYLNGMFHSDNDGDEDDASDDASDDDILSTSSQQIMPPPTRSFMTSRTSHATSFSSSSDDGPSSPQSGAGYASGDSSSASCSPLTSSGSETPPSSDEEMWEMHYLNKKRKLLTKAVSLMNREQVYDASIAGTAAGRQTFDTPLWKEARKMSSLGSQPWTRHSTIHQHKSLLGTKRPRIDLSSVYHVKGDIHAEIFMPQLCTVEIRNAAATPVSDTTLEEDSVSDTSTMDLAHAIAFSPVAQILAQASNPYTIVHANRAFSEFTGLSTGQVVGHSLDSIVTLSDATRLSTSVAQDDFVDAQVTTTSSNICKCLLRSVLVKDAPSHKPTVTFATSTKAECSPPVTHVLVQVKAPTGAVAEAAESIIIQTTSPQKCANTRVLETVG